MSDSNTVVTVAKKLLDQNENFEHLLVDEILTKTITFD